MPTHGGRGHDEIGFGLGEEVTELMGDRFRGSLAAASHLLTRAPAPAGGSSAQADEDCPEDESSDANRSYWREGNLLEPQHTELVEDSSHHQLC